MGKTEIGSGSFARPFGCGRNWAAGMGAGIIAWSCAGCGAAPDGTLGGGEELAVSSHAIEYGQLETGFPAVGYTGCTATLLTPSVALGAVHCNRNNMIFRVGTSASDWTGYHVDAAVGTPFKDLLLMHLETPVPNAQPLTINPGAYPAVGDECTIVGFGMHHNDDGTKGTGIKRSATVVVYGTDDPAIGDPRIKVNGVTGMTNGGDSGGPLICRGRIAGELKSGSFWPSSPEQATMSYTAVDPAWIAENIGVAPPTVSNSLYAQHGHVLYRIDGSLGNSQQMSDPGDDWVETTSMVALRGQIYVLQAGYLTRLNPNDGSFALIGAQDWTGPTTLTAIDESLYATQGFGLWKIDDLTTGAHHRLGDTDWTGATSMASVRGLLYIIKDSRLYKLSAKTGIPVQLGTPDWGGATSMAVIDSTLYVHAGGAIWRITDLNSGTYERVGTTDWPPPPDADPTITYGSLTALNGFLYLIQSGYLHRVDPSSGTYEVLNLPDWNNAEIMAALP